MFFLFNAYLFLQGGVDLRVDVIDPSGRRRTATVVDNTSGEGRYRAVYMGTVRGQHRATVFLHGTPMTNDHVFRVASPHLVERLNLRELFSIKYCETLFNCWTLILMLCISWEGQSTN